MNTPTPGIGDNSQPLTEEQLQALFFDHRRRYKDALAKKKEADANLRNACKRAKADGVDPKSIKFSIELENDEDGSIAKEQAERERIAAWMGLPLGGQADFFDRTPLVDRARADGKRAGMEGETCKPPHDAGGEAGQAWIAGWHEGQRALAETLPLLKGADTSVLIPGEHGDDDPDFDEIEGA